MITLITATVSLKGAFLATTRANAVEGESNGGD
jgi:hypothetical protein